MQSLLKIGFGANALAHFMAMMSNQPPPLYHLPLLGAAPLDPPDPPDRPSKLEKCVVSKDYSSHIFLQIANDFYLFASPSWVFFLNKLSSISQRMWKT